MPIECDNCDGDGYCPECGGGGVSDVDTTCPCCSGQGWCPECNGSGERDE